MHCKLLIIDCGNWQYCRIFEYFHSLLSLGTSEIPFLKKRITPPDYIFVYGTLRRDANSEMHQLLAKHTEFVNDATYQGKLYKIDYYPGAVSSDDPNDAVQGEVYLLHQADVVLPLLDRYEEFGPEFPEPNEFIRKQQAVLLKNGCSVMAWVYVYNHSTEDLELIKSANYIQQSL